MEPTAVIEEFYTVGYDRVIKYQGTFDPFYGTVSSVDGLVEERDLGKGTWRTEGEALNVLMEMVEREFKSSRLRLKQVKKLYYAYRKHTKRQNNI